MIRVGSTNVLAVEGDLTRQPVDAVVNAANVQLQHGGGVAAAIVRTGGRVIQEESDAWVRANGPLASGIAAVTTGGMLVASHVIHVAGPVFDESQDNEALLALAVRAALDAAADHEMRSVALPAISAGIYGYPADEAARVITAAVVDWIGQRPADLDEVRLVGYDRAMAQRFASALEG